MNLIAKYADDIQLFDSRNYKFKIGDMVRFKSYKDMCELYPKTHWNEDFFRDNKDVLFIIKKIKFKGMFGWDLCVKRFPENEFTTHIDVYGMREFNLVRR